MSVGDRSAVRRTWVTWVVRRPWRPLVFFGLGSAATLAAPDTVRRIAEAHVFGLPSLLSVATSLGLIAAITIGLFIAAVVMSFGVPTVMDALVSRMERARGGGTDRRTG